MIDMLHILCVCPTPGSRFPSVSYLVVLAYFGLVYDVYLHFQQYFSFIGGGNRRKPPACHMSLTNFHF